MSPRNDSYLSMCLEQAKKSPLHYRHGCIIVKGGKVIGQGYNDYRPGFEGGAVKHGNCVGAFDCPAAAELEQRTKLKSELKSKSKMQSQCTFTLYEKTVGSHSNTPLSMHSEMMAIQSALSLSSGTLSSQTSARSAKWLQKPCSKLPDASKRKARLQKLQAYVRAACEEANASSSMVSGGKFCLQESCFEASSSQSSQQGIKSQQKEEERGRGREGTACGRNSFNQSHVSADGGEVESQAGRVFRSRLSSHCSKGTLTTLL
jgi:deoxycytidylate deaminase